YEMLSGRPPFEGPTASDVIAAIIEREPVPLVRHRPEVPTELEWIVKKALRKDRDERYQTAREFLADLKNLSQRLDFEQELERSFDSAESRRIAFPSRESPSKSSHIAIDSLAILPLLNNYPDQSIEYFSDGVSESMINTLSRLSDLRVMAWSTVSQYKGRQVDPRQAGRELGVRAVLTGRLMQLSKRTDADVRNAIEYFKKAIEADPDYALAYVGLADAYLVLGGFGIATLAPKDAYPKARDALLRALEIDDTLAEAHASYGYCLGN